MRCERRVQCRRIAPPASRDLCIEAAERGAAFRMAPPPDVVRRRRRSARDDSGRVRPRKNEMAPHSSLATGRSELGLRRPSFEGRNSFPIPRCTPSVPRSKSAVRRYRNDIPPYRRGVAPYTLNIRRYRAADFPSPFKALRERTKSNALHLQYTALPLRYMALHLLYTVLRLK